MMPGFLRRDWWMRRHKGDPQTEQRWVVVDCETSGLDPEHDELLSIGAVGVRVLGATAEIIAGDSFEVLVRPLRTSDDDNVLVHGIGRAAQQSGQDPAVALTDFSAWVDGAPLIAFHAPFDRAFIQRACGRAKVAPPPRNWLDLAQLAPALWPQRRARALDDWLAAFELSAPGRHSAPGDALATALLLALMLPVAQRQGAQGIEALRRTANAMRWIQQP